MATGTSSDIKIELKKTFDFTIAGVPYRLKTSNDEATVQELVQFVHSKIEESMQATKHGSFQNAAVLTALHLAEELLLLKKKAHNELGHLEAKLLRLSQSLESSKEQTAGTC